jgi:hypothetical protein
MKIRGELQGWLVRSNRRRFFALVSAGILVSCQPAAAQFFGLGVVTTPTNVVPVNTTVVFTIDVTNVSTATLGTVLVTNVFSGSAPVAIVSSSTSQGTVVSDSSSVVFNLGPMAGGGVAEMTVTTLPSNSGVFSNSVTVVSPFVTNQTSTNVLVQVLPSGSDLAVALAPPSGPILVGDWFTYGVTITNLGTNDVAAVLLLNSGLNGLNLIQLTPSGQPYTLTNGLLLLNAGTLPGGGGQTFSITVQPTNAGTVNLTSSVSSTNITDSNPTNNTASASLTVEPLVLGQLLATNASAMVYNPQTGLMEQTVHLSNLGSNAVASARVIVSGLTNRLFNAVGTNNGAPYVVYGAALDPGQGVDLLLEYFVPTRLPIPVANSAYTAVGTSAVNLGVASAAAPNITLVTNLVGGGVLIEFASVPGRSYTVLYSDNSSFTNALAAQPAIVAPADRVQWIDNGPPKTVSHPLNSSARFYRVRLNP